MLSLLSPWHRGVFRGRNVHAAWRDTDWTVSHRGLHSLCNSAARLRHCAGSNSETTLAGLSVDARRPGAFAVGRASTVHGIAGSWATSLSQMHEAVSTRPAWTMLRSRTSMLLGVHPSKPPTCGNMVATIVLRPPHGPTPSAAGAPRCIWAHLAWCGWGQGVGGLPCSHADTTATDAALHSHDKDQAAIGDDREGLLACRTMQHGGPGSRISQWQAAKQPWMPACQVALGRRGAGSAQSAGSWPQPAGRLSDVSRAQRATARGRGRGRERRPTMDID